MEYVRNDLAEIKAEQKVTSAAIASLAAATEKLSAKVDASELKLSAQIASQLAILPTKTDLKNYYMQSLAIGFAFLVLVVGGIVGGLDWIKVH